MAAVESRHQSSNSAAEHFGGVAQSCLSEEAVGEDDSCTLSTRIVSEPKLEHELQGSTGRDARSSHIAMDLLTDDLLLQVRVLVSPVSNRRVCVIIPKCCRKMQ